MVTKPPVTYAGGKTAIAPRIAALLPAHEHYIEPFAGSLAVLLAKPRSDMETISDLDGEIVNFWRVLRDRPDDLARACALTPHSRGEYQASYAALPLSDLERARLLWVRLTQGRGGNLGKRTGWRYCSDARGRHASMPDYLAAYVARICPAAERLTGVSLEHRPALDLIADYGQHPNNLIYADPPYPRSARSWDRGPAYAREMRADADHEALAAALRSARAAVVLSAYPGQLYDRLYAGWERIEITVTAGNATTRTRTEVIWANRPLPHQPSLFTEAAP